MLIFPLKKQWYEKIKSGEKTIEYREVKEFWCRRFYNEMITELKSIYGSKILKTFPNFSEFIEKLNDSPWLFGAILQSTSKVWNCKLQLGYTNRYMTAKITNVEIINGKDTDLKIDKPVFAIYLANVKEV